MCAQGASGRQNAWEIARGKAGDKAKVAARSWGEDCGKHLVVYFKKARRLRKERKVRFMAGRSTLAGGPGTRHAEKLSWGAGITQANKGVAWTREGSIRAGEVGEPERHWGGAYFLGKADMAYC